MIKADTYEEGKAIVKMDGSLGELAGEVGSILKAFEIEFGKVLTERIIEHYKLGKETERPER